MLAELKPFRSMLSKDRPDLEVDYNMPSDSFVSRPDLNEIKPIVNRWLVKMKPLYDRINSLRIKVRKMVLGGRFKLTEWGYNHLDSIRYEKRL